MEIIDISAKIEEGMTIYPGNPGVAIRTGRRNNVTLSRLEMGSHTGTHMDAPRHVYQKGRKASQVNLNSAYGKCIVLDMSKVKGHISRKDLIGKGLHAGDIVLFKTRNRYTGRGAFRKDYVYISKDAAEYLHGLGVKAVGIDCLSIEGYGKSMDAHRIILKNAAVFEGLCLGGVAPGRYTFIGLPLKIDAEASPVRAVLIR